MIMPCAVLNDKDDRDRRVERFDIEIREILGDIKPELILTRGPGVAGAKFTHPSVAIGDPVSDRFAVSFQGNAYAGGRLAAAQIENMC